MLSVNDGRSRNRSKSPGGRRDRSTSRDMRAPSPARRAPSPVRAASPPRSSRKSKKYYESDTESEDATESESEGERRSTRRREDERYERKKRDESYEREDPRRRRSEYDEDEGKRRESKYKDDEYEKKYKDDDDRRYGKHGKYEYAKREEYEKKMSYKKHDDDRKDYKTPGSFDTYDEDDRDEKRRQKEKEYYKDEYGRSPTNEKPQAQFAHGYVNPIPGTVPYTMSTGGRGQYSDASKYQYAQPAGGLQYTSRQGDPHYPQYIAKPATEIEREREKLRREKEDQEYEKRERMERREREENEQRRKADRKERKEREAREDEERQKRERMEERERKEQEEMEKLMQRERNRDLVERHDRELAEKDDKKRRNRLQLEDSHESRSRNRSHSSAQFMEIKPKGQSLGAPPSPGLGPRMHRLSVSGGYSGQSSLAAPGMGGHHIMQGGLPPGSPLLEAYRGTYQSISPMPSPMALPRHLDEGLSDLEPLEGDSDEDDDGVIRPRKSILKKRVVVYDPEHDAIAIGDELKHTKPDTKPLIKILPTLSDDNLMALRAEYKKHYKAGGKGINVAKHIKLKIKGNIGAIIYATALGRWESEAHWANFWYQSGTSRRELLIESLIGRTNQEIRKIKEAFSDKRYNDSLEKCMQTELKKDKFRTAILLALEEKRQDETAPLSRTVIDRDVRDLYKALVAKEGGETAMIEIVVIRSNNHLREVMKEFEHKYKENFARRMIQKSQNLVVSDVSPTLSFPFLLNLRDELADTWYRVRH